MHWASWNISCLFVYKVITALQYRPYCNLRSQTHICLFCCMSGNYYHRWNVPDGTNVSKSNKMASSLENLETQLEMFIENVRQIRIIVGDFQPQGQNVLNQKMWVFYYFIVDEDQYKYAIHLITRVMSYLKYNFSAQWVLKTLVFYLFIFSVSRLFTGFKRLINWNPMYRKYMYPWKCSSKCWRIMNLYSIKLHNWCTYCHYFF